MNKIVIIWSIMAKQPKKCVFKLQALVLFQTYSRPYNNMARLALVGGEPAMLWSWILFLTEDLPNRAIFSVLIKLNINVKILLNLSKRFYFDEMSNKDLTCGSMWQR